jgi:hypothetical protein
LIQIERVEIRLRGTHRSTTEHIIRSSRLCCEERILTSCTAHGIKPSCKPLTTHQSTYFEKMAGLSFAAALIGAKTSSTTKDVVATADVPVPIVTPSSEGTKDERPSSAPSASQSVEPATSTRSSTTKRQESQKNDNQNNGIDNENKSKYARHTRVILLLAFSTL